MKIAVAVLSKSYWNSQDNHPSIFFIFMFIYSHEQDADQLKFVPGGQNVCIIIWSWYHTAFLPTADFNPLQSDKPGFH